MSKFAAVETAVEVHDLKCSAPGCSSAWSISLGRNLCSWHQWGRSQSFDSAAASPFAEQDFGSDGKAWARRMLARAAAGERILRNNVAMAEAALGSKRQM